MSTQVLPVACMVLAAGSSKRFGSDKRQARLKDGSSLLDATLASIPADFCQYLLIVHRGDEALANKHQQHWVPIIANDAALGMGHSVAAGIAALEPCEGVLIALADMPGIQAATFITLSRQMLPDSIVVPRFQGQRGNPLVIGKRFFPELLALQGDSGARTLLQQHSSDIVWVDCDDPGILRDIDTPQDLE